MSYPFPIAVFVRGLSETSNLSLLQPVVTTYVGSLAWQERRVVGTGGTKTMAKQEAICAGTVVSTYYLCKKSVGEGGDRALHALPFCQTSSGMLLHGARRGKSQV